MERQVVKTDKASGIVKENNAQKARFAKFL